MPTTKRNPQLFIALNGYFAEAIRVWSKTYESGLPSRAFMKPHFEKNSITYTTEIGPDFSRLIHDQQIRDPGRVPSLRAVERFMREDGEIGKHLDAMVGFPGSSSAS